LASFSPLLALPFLPTTTQPAGVSVGGERRPPDDPGEAEERDSGGPRLPEEGGQGVARRARGGVAGAAASCVLGFAVNPRLHIYIPRSLLSEAG